MPMRTTYSQLKELEKRVNHYLRNVKVRVSKRYDYYAIDLYHPSGEYQLDTLVSGLTAKEAREILEALANVLWYEFEKQNI